MSVSGISEVASTSSPSDLVNNSCIGFVYEFRLMSKDGVDSLSVFVCLRENARWAAVIGIFTDARE